MALVFTLPGALSYGIADFAGGLASRRGPVLGVTAAIQFAGLVALAPVTPFVDGRPSAAAFGYGAVAGIAGAAGLLLYLRALALGPMGVVAPLSAVVGAGLPLAVGVLDGESLGPVTLIGVGIALIAILLATAGGPGGAATRVGPLLALGAGAGFAAFFVLLDRAPTDSGLWPLLAGRLTSTPLLVIAALATGVRVSRMLPVRLMLLSGVFDTLANVLFLLSTRGGDLGVSAVVVSLYPVVVALLAGVVLKERLTRLQLGGAGLALGASVLLAVGG
jgi:uncharacterized membrane protein